MTEFIINCVQTGAYSAIFALLLVYIVKSNLKRESYYRRFITELCASLRDINEISGKLDGLIDLAEKSAGKKKKDRPAYIDALTAYAGGEGVS